MLAERADDVLAAGVPLFPEAPSEVMAWVTGLVDDLRALPADDPRRPTDEEAVLVDDGLDRIHEAAACSRTAGYCPPFSTTTSSAMPSGGPGAG